MPRRWPPLTAREIADCLKALGCQLDRKEATHEIWIHPKSHRIGVVDVKWKPVSSETLKHLVEEQLGFSRAEFYGATKATSKKI